MEISASTESSPAIAHGALSSTMVHKVYVPRFSSVHRYACQALYRALLRQCSRLPSPSSAPELHMCKPLIRQRFHKYKTLESPTQTANALKAGYEALDLLYSASQGDHKATSHIANLLSETESARQKQIEVQRARSARVPVKPLSKKEQKRKDAKEHEKRTLTRYPTATSILSRPRPVVKGKRRIPVLVNARGIPFLRIKKPQPKFLSDVIRSRLGNRWKRISRRERLHAELEMAKDEDYWDSLTMGTERATWGHEIKASLTDVNNKIYDTDAEAKWLAQSMWKVVLAERELAAEEQEHQSAAK